MYKNFFKPLFDFLASLIGIIVVSPILIIVSIALTFQNRGTPFFFQVRPGKNQKAFKIIKFKTMTDQSDNIDALIPDVDRITKLGKVLRKLSIDELPQLINVLKGEMSLVGPRPLLFKYIHLYSKEQLRRHEVRPGITGWAQVNGRNSIPWIRKFELDLEYVDELSFILDIKILYITCVKVIKREGVHQVLPFNGSN